MLSTRVVGNQYYIDCWTRFNRVTIQGFIEVSQLSPEIQLLIKNRKSNQIKIVKGDSVVHDGANYNLIEDTYTIEKDKDGLEFIKFNALKN